VRLLFAALFALAAGAYADAGLATDDVAPGANDVTAPKADDVAVPKADTFATKNDVRLFWAKSSDTDLTTAWYGDYDASKESGYLIGASYGRRFSDTLFGLPFPMTANIGVQWLNERGLQDNGWGTTAYIKAHYTWKLPATTKHITLGLGEGLSYVSVIPLSEQRDFARKNGAQSEHLLNYVEWTIDVPLRQFATFEPMFQGSRIQDVTVGFVVWHRSSIYGLLAETKGGVNYMGFGLQARF
jgi:hypothetical protein